MRTRNEKGLYGVEYNRLHDKEWLLEQYTTLRKTTTQIAQELGCVNSTVHVAIIRSGIPKRSRSEARIGIVFSDTHLENITMANRVKALKGSAHPNWQGGKTRTYEARVSAIKRDPKYKAWREAVISIGYCEGCGSVEELEAHHKLPKSLFPHLIHDISNGMCLCKNCHTRLHSLKKGMNSGKPRTGNPEPSQSIESLEGATTTGEPYTVLNDQLERPCRKA